MHPILKYPGAKWRIAPWIIDKMPPHTGYIEPFFGSGAVFFNKTPSYTETINDADGAVVRFFRTCREKPGVRGRKYHRGVVDVFCPLLHWGYVTNQKHQVVGGAEHAGTNL